MLAVVALTDAPKLTVSHVLAEAKATTPGLTETD